MSDLLSNEQEHGRSRVGLPKELNALVSNFFSRWLDFSAEKNAVSPNQPKVEITESPNEVVVRAEMPGVQEDDIDLEMSSDGYLAISGERKQEQQEEDHDSYFSEFSYGSFCRCVPLPWDLKLDEARADFENGILRIVFPKSPNEQNKKRKIAINRKQPSL